MKLFSTRSPDVAEVMPGLLIGSSPPSRDRRQLSRRGVSCVLDLRAEAPDRPSAWPVTVSLRRFPIEDRAAPALADLVELVEWIRARIDSGETVFVHCQGGIGRAATVACAVLVSMGYDVAEAYRLLRGRRAAIAPTDAQLALLQRYAEAAARRA